ncbi:polar localization protein TipN [Phenylobacterium soli]|uniref:Polar localization protein TipN n=2 Tax=Phenylobacterium soli TaxID=2170551 RepID=A0A328AK69_9CAUL|nr:polar localization protein TipN [Phenylobacterium soli]
MDFGASNDEGLTPAEMSSGETPSAATAEPVAIPEPAAPLQPPQMNAKLAAAEPRVPARRPEPPDALEAVEFAPPSPWPIYLTALAVSVMWGFAPLAFAVGYRHAVAPLNNDAFALAVFSLLSIGPAILVWGGAYMIRQAQKLAYEARRAKAMADEMLAPALTAAAQAGHVVQGVRDEILRAGGAADEARETLLALRDALALEAERLAETTSHSVRTAKDLAGELGRERVEMSELAMTLDAQATRVTDAIGQQAKMVSDAAELADTQLREAEAQLSARAADLAAAAGEASDAARTAGEDLTRHIARLETAGVGVSEQVKAVEIGLSEQRAALTTLASALRADNESFTAEAEAHAARLAEFISQARLSAVEMSDRAAKGGEALKGLMAEAAAQFRDLAETARAEREEFGQSTLQSLEAVSDAAAEQRRQLEAQTRAAIEALHAAAEETRQAAAAHAATAKEQVEQLSEAAFAAGQKANQVFEKRLEEAKALVEQSSKMVEEAGAATARKLDEGAAAARASLDELAGMLGEIEARAQRLPASAKAQSEEVRSAVLHGMDELMAAAHRTAEEAQAIDVAFQERVRRNFEMLSEAVRLMGTATAAAPIAVAPIVAPTPTQPAPRAASGRISAQVKARTAPPSSPAPEPVADDALELDELAAPAAAAEPSGADLADQIGLRPRLKLTPTATDAEFSAVFEAAGGPPAAKPASDDEAEEGEGGEAWTWKDLLASIDGAEAEGERLQDQLGAELERMGVEPDKLLPKARIDEIAAAVQTGDGDGARQVVKRLAPAATRRISRRLSTDAGVKRQALTYIRRYQTLIQDAAVRDPEGFLLAGMLAESGGRLYLLLDTAAGDAV